MTADQVARLIILAAQGAPGIQMPDRWAQAFFYASFLLLMKTEAENCCNADRLRRGAYQHRHTHVCRRLYGFDP